MTLDIITQQAGLVEQVHNIQFLLASLVAISLFNLVTNIIIASRV